MTIHVAGWVLWALGSIVGVLVLGLAVFGVIGIAMMCVQDRAMMRWLGW